MSRFNVMPRIRQLRIRLGEIILPNDVWLVLPPLDEEHKPPTVIPPEAYEWRSPPPDMPPPEDSETMLRRLEAKDTP